MSDTHKDALGELAERLRTMFSDKGHSQVIDGHRWWSLSLQNERDIAAAADALEGQGWVGADERLLGFLSEPDDPNISAREEILARGVTEQQLERVHLQVDAMLAGINPDQWRAAWDSLERMLRSRPLPPATESEEEA